MTIDEKSFHFFFQSNPSKATELINQVKEVTGSNEEEIKRAFDQSKDSNGEFCLQGAVDFLLGSNGVVSTTSNVPTYQQSIPPPAPSPQKTKVVDLTEDNKSEDDLQRAIALSLQDGGLVSQNTAATSTAVSGISQEEQDVSKALEASLRESSQVHRKKDSQNPHDRQREGQWPVGLKNVGMTCWFSAVIQSLFHIPAFRTLVINYNPPSPDTVTENGRKVLEFMSELRKLFSLLLNSQRKYVDPSRAIELLRGSLGGESSQSFSNQCHDVSEFTHKLLDWLEEAFNFNTKQKSPLENVKQEGKVDGGQEPMDSETEKMDKEKDSLSEEPPSQQDNAESVGNPMCSLFYGQFEIEIRAQGTERRRRREKFGQWPLTVNDVSNIHESLERSMAYQATESDETGGVISGQERWFTCLPPVLFLELSRFQFNTSRVMVEKVNNTLEFGQEIFLDRYLEANKQLVREKREEVRKLVEKRGRLSQQLDCFLKFGSDQSQSEASQYPLVNILQSALEFARSGEGPGREGESEVTMQVDSPCHSPASLTPASSLSQLASADNVPTPDPASTSPPGLEDMESTTSQDAMEVECEDGQVAAMHITAPKPKHVSEMEMKVLSSCFNRWIQEVEEDISRLSQALRDIESSISVMYENESLKARGYRLHAVMVHGGDVNIGHYWAYVKHTERGWLKFNDNTVSQTTWEEIIKEAAGGKTTTSAYSLVYVDVARDNLFTEAAAYLPTDLDVFVMEDNKNFAAEILKWDEDQHRVKTEPSCDQSVLIGDDPECQIIEPDLSQSHALLARDITLECFNHVANERNKQEHNKNSTSLVINKMFTQVKTKIQKCKQTDFGERNDPRLDSFVHYLVANELSIDHYKKALLEQVALKEFESMSDIGREVSKTARDALKNIDPRADQEVVIWHRSYHQFRIVVNYFVLGVEKYADNCLEEALDLLTTSYVVNEKLENELPQPNVYKVFRRLSKNNILTSNLPRPWSTRVWSSSSSWPWRPSTRSW